jgi:hypothetical protein
VEFRVNVFKKNGNWLIFFWETPEKLAHLEILTPKIIYA